MNNDDQNELASTDMWDEGEIRPAIKAPRAVVSVSFSRDDFDRVAAYARQQNLKTSEFIRTAALTVAAPQTREYGTPVVTGPVQTMYSMREVPHGKIRVTISPPRACATA